MFDRLFHAKSIPSKEVGKLIGKGGETIKQLSSSSGTKIDIPKTEAANAEVTVGGPAKANVDNALAQISKLLGRTIQPGGARKKKRVLVLFLSLFVF